MDKCDREQFLLELKLGVEQEYNVPGKPEDAKKSDKKVIKDKMEKLINSFCQKHNITFQEIKEYILECNNERRGVNPTAKDEFNLIEEILYEISEEQGKETR